MNNGLNFIRRLYIRLHLEESFFEEAVANKSQMMMFILMRMMMMMNWFVKWTRLTKKFMLCFISPRDHCQADNILKLLKLHRLESLIYYLLKIFQKLLFLAPWYNLVASFKSMSNRKPGFVEWIDTILIITTAPRHSLMKLRSLYTWMETGLD